MTEKEETIKLLSRRLQDREMELARLKLANLKEAKLREAAIPVITSGHLHVGKLPSTSTVKIELPKPPTESMDLSLSPQEVLEQ